VLLEMSARPMESIEYIKKKLEGGRVPLDAQVLILLCRGWYNYHAPKERQSRAQLIIVTGLNLVPS